MAIEFGASIGTPHHNHAIILASTDPTDAVYHAIDLSNIVPLGTNAIWVDGHITSTNTDDDLCMADSATPTHCHHVATNVANKESEGIMLVEIDAATRMVYWKVSDARVTDVQIEMYWSFR